MRFFIEKISKLDIGWNERPLGDADLELLCRRFGITVYETALATDGFYYRVMNRDFIAVNSRLGPIKKLTVLFHELGRFLFHAPQGGPTADFHGVGRRTRKELEADLFALCAVIPKMRLACGSVHDLADEGFSHEMIADRYELHRLYNI